MAGQLLGVFASRGHVPHSSDDGLEGWKAPLDGVLLCPAVPALLLGLGRPGVRNPAALEALDEAQQQRMREHHAQDGTANAQLDVVSEPDHEEPPCGGVSEAAQGESGELASHTDEGIQNTPLLHGREQQAVHEGQHCQHHGHVDQEYPQEAADRAGH
eukprot:CAMPEP_0113819014 /NCGR_PEP_ID=MMETSP0328-20130328/528_1 /TAXON_ID=39455 /ORGANISM="Alexandrium minutum" /LENGTH=157 /DNA_ID=CAMNT_0000786949 /DNA_START=88 /DNA_END=561 /DNA_ORIENTATION=+ /assembly_acc=CAM_ASM_000350